MVSVSLSCLHYGKLQQFVPAWKEITYDSEVLDWLEHCHIEFIDGAPPLQKPDYKIIKFNYTESTIIDSKRGNMKSTHS